MTNGLIHTGKESKYAFFTPEKLIQDFLRESRRVDDEDRDP